MSTDPNWNPADAEIARLAELGPLQSGETYWRTNLVRVQVIKSGTYYVIFKADAGSSLYELNETNNMLVVPITFDLVPPDLAPLVLDLPSVLTGPPDLTMNLVWGVTNQGHGAALGSPYWHDRVYLSRGPLLDEDDDDVVDTRTMTALDAGSSCWRTIKVVLPVFRSGFYYLFFKTDADNSLPESNEANNVLAVPLTINVLFPASFGRAVERFPDGTVRLQVFGAVGLPYALHASRNLVAWTLIGEFTCTNSPMSVVHPQASDFDYRFYRLKSLAHAPSP